MAIGFAEVLREDLRSSDEGLRYAALRRVDPEACELYFHELAACLGDASWRVRKAAVSVLAACSDTLRLWTVIRPAIASEDNAGLRSAAAELMQKHRQMLASQLIELTQAGSANLRKLAIEALSQESSDEQIFACLLDALKDTDANVRAAAVEALADSEQPRALQALRDILAMPKTQDALVQLAALKGLAKAHTVLSLTEIQNLLQRPLLRDNAISLLSWAWEPEAVNVLVPLLQSGKRVSVREAVLALYQRWQQRPSERTRIKAELRQISLPSDLLRKLVCKSVNQDILDATLFLAGLAADKNLFAQLFSCMEHFSNVTVLADTFAQLSIEEHLAVVAHLSSMASIRQQQFIEAHALNRIGLTCHEEILCSMLGQWSFLSLESFSQLLDLIGENAGKGCVADLLKMGRKSGRFALVAAALKQIGRRMDSAAQQEILLQARHAAWPELKQLELDFSTLPFAQDHTQDDGQESAHFSQDIMLRLAQLVRKDSGLELAQPSWVRVEHRVHKRMASLGIAHVQSYLELLQNQTQEGAAERQSLTEMLTIHETYFFREPRQLHAVESEILPDLVKIHRSERRLRFWSAGCSTGEEAYTLAMLLKRSELLQNWDLHITGTDISQQVVQKARAACYPKNSFRADEFEEELGDFVRRGERLCVTEQIKKMVNFRTENLLWLELQKQRQAQYDLIMCRNVFIYFAPQIQRRLAKMFFQMLRPGGYLLLGHAESLLSYELDFELVTLRDDLVYRRSQSRKDRV